MATNVNYYRSLLKKITQFITMLYIVQDYLEYKCLLYEHLDESSRSEEKFLSIKNFNKNETTSVFLMSTKAGGQVISLTSDGTVIFLRH